MAKSAKRTGRGPLPQTVALFELFDKLGGVVPYSTALPHIKQFPAAIKRYYTEVKEEGGKKKRMGENRYSVVRSAHLRQNNKVAERGASGGRGKGVRKAKPAAAAPAGGFRKSLRATTAGVGRRASKPAIASAGVDVFAEIRKLGGRAAVQAEVQHLQGLLAEVERIEQQLAAVA